MERVPPPPPPAPPPPPPPGTPGNPPGTPGLGRVLREALQRAGQALGEDGGLRELLRRRRDSFKGPWKWLVFHRPVPPLIQDGPQCGLVALAMAGALLGPPRPQLGLGTLLDTARARGYTRHGEMFSAAQMAALAQELLPCRAELLRGGLGGSNQGRVLRHLLRGRALLVPYDEDSNHAPSCRRGHKAHWALINEVRLIVRCALYDVQSCDICHPGSVSPQVPSRAEPAWWRHQASARLGRVQRHRGSSHAGWGKAQRCSPGGGAKPPALGQQRPGAGEARLNQGSGSTERTRWHQGTWSTRELSQQRGPGDAARSSSSGHGPVPGTLHGAATVGIARPHQVQAGPGTRGCQVEARPRPATTQGSWGRILAAKKVCLIVRWALYDLQSCEIC